MRGGSRIGVEIQSGAVLGLVRPGAHEAAVLW